MNKESSLDLIIKRWLYLAVGTFMLLCLGLIYAWSIFASPFKELFPSWSNFNLSLTFSISMISFCIGGFIGGKLHKKINTITVIRVSACIIFFGFFQLSKLNPESQDVSLIMLYVFYGILCGGGVGLCYNAVIGTVNRWFPDKVGFASGILLMGYGFGGILLGGIIKVLIDNMSLFNTFLVLAYAMFIVIVAGSFILKVPDREINDISNTNTNKLSNQNYSSSEMIKTGTFWYFFLWSITVSSSGLLVVNSAATIAETFGAPAVLGLLVSVFNGLGRVLFGQIFDKFGYSKAIMLICLTLMLSGIFLTIGSISESIIMIFAGLLLVGVSFGGGPSLASSFIHSVFGARNYAENFSIVNFTLIPAAAIGPIISSSLLERFNGRYTSTFIMIIVLSMFGFVLYALLSKNIKKLARY